MSAVEVLSSEVDSMNMWGRGNGECKSLLAVVWLFLALGWIGTGAVAAQEARSYARPAGGVWTSSGDLFKYVRLEMDKAKLRGGKRLVSTENLLAGRAPQIALGEDATYGMGLEVGAKYGVPVVSHGGSMAGFKSNWYLLPDSQVGVVILTNSDTGGMLLGPFSRRLLEVVFDGKLEAEGDLAAQAPRYRAQLAKERERLVVPAGPDLVAKVAKKYTCKELGEIDVLSENGQTVFNFGEWKSAVASRKNDDGSFRSSRSTRRMTGLGWGDGGETGADDPT